MHLFARIKVPSIPRKVMSDNSTSFSIDRAASSRVIRTTRSIRVGAMQGNMSGRQAKEMGRNSEGRTLSIENENMLPRYVFAPFDGN